MIGDVLLVSEKHTRAAARIAEILARLREEKIVVAIAGESGTGKSEVAHELRRILKSNGLLVKILHGDNYYKTMPAERSAWRRKHGLSSIGESEYDWDTLNENINEFRQGRRSVLPFFDLFTNQKDLLITHFKDINILIIEGLYCMKVDADIKFFIDMTYKETEKAQIIRGKETLDDFRKQVLARESEVVQTHRILADYLITRTFQIVPNTEKHK